jgi:hypothetical protein
MNPAPPVINVVTWHLLLKNLASPVEGARYRFQGMTCIITPLFTAACRFGT